MRKRFCLDAVALLMVVVLAACSGGTAGTGDNGGNAQGGSLGGEASAALGSGMLLPEGELSLEALEASACFFVAAGGKAYRVVFDFEQAGLEMDRVIRNAVRFLYDESVWDIQSLSVRAADSVYIMENFYREDYNGFQVVVVEDRADLSYDMREDSGFILIELGLTHNLKSENEGDYDTEVGPLIRALLDATTVTELSGVDTSSHYFIHPDTEIDEPNVYPVGSVLRIDDTLSLDLTGLHSFGRFTAVDDRLAYNEFSYDFDYNYLGRYTVVPQDRYDEERGGPWGGFADSFRHMLDDFVVETHTVGGVEFALADYQFETTSGTAHTYVYTYQGDGFSVVFTFWQMSEGSPTLEEQLDLLERIVV